MPTPDAPVIASATFNVTRDDVYAIYLWTGVRTPAMQRLIRRNRRIHIGVLTACALAVPALITYVTYNRGSTLLVIFTIALVVGAVNAALLLRSARKTGFGADATRAGFARLVRKGIDHGDHDANLGPVELRVTDHDLVNISDTSAIHFPWTDCDEAEFTTDELSFHFGPHGGVRVPLRAFAIDADKRRFLQACVDRLPNHVRAAALASPE